MSTNIFTGFSSDKPSSRCSNPPGGRSHNLFGCDDDQASKSKTQQENIRPAVISNVFTAPPQDANSMKKVNNRMKSNIFGEDQTRLNENNANKKRAGFNPITGKYYDDEQSSASTSQTGQQASNQASSAQAAAAAAPPPTEVKQDEAVQQQEQARRPIHTSSKVLQPPGGKSTKLW
jgi:hypothetical protein